MATRAFRTTGFLLASASALMLAVTPAMAQQASDQTRQVEDENKTTKPCALITTKRGETPEEIADASGPEAQALASQFALFNDAALLPEFQAGEKKRRECLTGVFGLSSTAAAAPGGAVSGAIAAAAPVTATAVTAVPVAGGVAAIGAGAGLGLGSIAVGAAIGTAVAVGAVGVAAGLGAISGGGGGGGTGSTTSTVE